jgi:hypothetical protein
MLFIVPAVILIDRCGRAAVTPLSKKLNFLEFPSSRSYNTALM